MAKGKKKWIPYIILVVIVAGISVAIGFTLYPGQEEAETVTPTIDLTTFTLKDAVTSEDVSWNKVSFWVPTSVATFTDANDKYDLGNFKELYSSVTASSLSYDMSNIEYAYLEINPDLTGVYNHTYILITGGSNWNYIKPVYHPSSDLNFIWLNKATMGAITAASYNTDANLTCYMDVPHYVSDPIDVGTNWNMTLSDYQDLSASAQLYYHDEANFMAQAPLYDPTVDISDHRYDISPLTSITSAPALKIVTDNTITLNEYQANLNCTFSKDNDYNIITLVDNDTLYFVFTDVLTFNTGAMHFDFEMTFLSTAISISTISSVRLQIPGSYTSSPSVELIYSSMGA